MKLKSIYLILFLTLSVINKHAQCEEKIKHKSINGFTFGFTIGNFNKNFIGSDFDSQAGAGFTIGYKNLKGISKNFSSSFEIIYNNRSARFEGRNSSVKNINISNGNTSAAKNYQAYSFNYLEVPLIFYWHPGNQYIDHRSNSPEFNVKLGLGFSPAFSIGARYRYNQYIADEPPPGPLSMPVNVTEKQRVRTFNDSKNFVGSIIIDIHAGISHGEKSTFFLSGRYYHMLNSVFNEEYPKIKLHTFAFGAGWLF